MLTDAIPFARALTDNLSRARQHDPSADQLIPPHLYSVFAVKDPAFSVICHSALVVEVEPEVVLAEGGLLRDGVGTIAFEAFLHRESRNGNELFEFSPQVLDGIYWL